MARKKQGGGGGGAVLAGAAVVALFIFVANHQDVDPEADGAHRLRRRVPTTDACRGPRAFPQSPQLPWRLHDAFTTDCGEQLQGRSQAEARLRARSSRRHV